MNTPDQPPMSPEELQRRLRAGELSIELAPQDRVAAYPRELDDILEALGFPEALVTDESCVSDFLGFDTDVDEQAQALTEASARLGIPVTLRGTLLVDLAAQLRQHRERPS